MKLRRIKTEHDFGPLIALAAYLKVGRTWLSALKKCAARRASEAPASEGRLPPNPSPFVGNKATAARIRGWLDRNPDFQPSKEYPRRKTPQLQP